MYFDLFIRNLQRPVHVKCRNELNYQEQLPCNKYMLQTLSENEEYVHSSKSSAICRKLRSCVRHFVDCPAQSPWRVVMFYSLSMKAVALERKTSEVLWFWLNLQWIVSIIGTKLVIWFDFIVWSQSLYQWFFTAVQTINTFIVVKSRFNGLLL